MAETEETMNNAAAYAAVLALSDATGLPVRYKTDITEHLKETLAEAEENTKFVVMLRDSGTNYINLEGVLASESFSEVCTVFGNHNLYYWNGESLKPTNEQAVIELIGEDVVNSEHTVKEVFLSVPSFSEMLGSLPLSIRSHIGTERDCEKYAERNKFLGILQDTTRDCLMDEYKDYHEKWSKFFDPKKSVKSALEFYYTGIVHRFMQQSQNHKDGYGCICVLNEFRETGESGAYSAYYYIRKGVDGALLENGAIWVEDGRVSVHT